MTQNVTVKDKLARDVWVETHEQTHLARRHRLIRGPIGTWQSHWHVDRVQHSALDELVVAFQHAEMQLMDVEVVDLMREVEDRPFLDAVRLDLDHRQRPTWIGLDGYVRPGHFRDEEVCLAVLGPLILGERKGPATDRHGAGRHSICALQYRPRRNSALPARVTRWRRIDPDRDQVARRHQVSGTTRVHCLGLQNDAMPRGCKKI